MISKVLSDIGNVGIYPVVTLTIFFTIFSIMLIKVWLGKKSEYDKMAALPLTDDRERIAEGGENGGNVVKGGA